MRYIKILFITLIIGLFQPIFAQNNNVDPLIQYQLGGASAYNRAFGYSDTEILKISAKANLSLNCNGFDLEQNLKELMEQFSNLDDKIANLVSAFASSIISSLPLLILREINPNLADLLEDYSSRFEELYRISVADCKQIQDAVSEGDTFYGGWVNAIKGAAWVESNENGESATTAQINSEKGGDIIWIDGQKAGKTKDLNVVGDLVGFGYSKLTGNSSSGLASPVKELFNSANNASRYAVRVFGETTINYKTGMKSTVGGGVLPEVEKTFNDKVILFNTIINSGIPSVRQLNEVSSSYIPISSKTISILQNFEENERNFYIQRLSSEIAVAEEYEKLNALRRMILAAKREPNVSNSQAYAFINNELLPEIRDEMDILLKQVEISKTFGSTSQKIILTNQLKEENQPVKNIGAEKQIKTLEGIPLKNE